MNAYKGRIGEEIYEKRNRSLVLIKPFLALNLRTLRPGINYLENRMSTTGTENDVSRVDPER